MIVVLCGAEGAKVQQEWASRTDVTELHAVGFYPTATGRGIVVHQRPEKLVAEDLTPDIVVGGTSDFWPQRSMGGWVSPSDYFIPLDDIPVTNHTADVVVDLSAERKLDEWRKSLGVTREETKAAVDEFNAEIKKRRGRPPKVKNGDAL